MGRELGRFVERRREELGLTRRQLADLSELSYPYVSQIESGEREPALKAIRKLAPVLDVRPEDLAGLVAGGDWATTGSGPYASAPDMVVGRLTTSEAPSYKRDKVLLSLERRLRAVPPLERIALLNEMISGAVEELAERDRR